MALQHKIPQKLAKGLYHDLLKHGLIDMIPSIKITTFTTDIKKKEGLPSKLSCVTGTLKIHKAVTTVVGNTVIMSASDLSARLSLRAYRSLSG